MWPRVGRTIIRPVSHTHFRNDKRGVLPSEMLDLHPPVVDGLNQPRDRRMLHHFRRARQVPGGLGRPLPYWANQGDFKSLLKNLNNVAAPAASDLGACRSLATRGTQTRA